MELLEIIKRHFPNATGAVLTGSYLTNNYSTSFSDVDILIFDSLFSTISPLIVHNNGMRIDFTLIPINNIDNVFRNEQFDQRGILLTMLAKGEIIKDNQNNIILKIKEKAEKLFNKGIHNNLPTYKALLKGLSKIRKEFFKDPKPYQRTFLVNEFFHLVTQIELIKTANWRMSGRHKADYLYEINNTFIADLLDVTNNAHFETSLGGFQEIGIYIDKYLAHSVDLESHRLFGKRYFIIDLDYEKLNIEHFANIFLTKIDNSSLLSKAYKYFYLSHSTKSRIYKNKLSICFDKNSFNSQKEIEKKILEELHSIFSVDLKLHYRYSVIPSFDLNETIANNNLITAFDDCSCEISKLIKNLIITYGKYDVKRHLIISSILNSFLIGYLKIEKKDAVQLLYYLSSRYVINQNEQNKLSPNTILEFKKNKYNQHHEYYRTNKDVFVEAVEKGKSIALKNEPISTKLYATVIEKLKSFLELNHQFKSDLIDDNSLTLSIINAFIKHSDIKNCLIFVLIFEHLLPLLLLNSDQTTLQLTILSEIEEAS